MTSSINVTLTPAEAAQVVERIIALADERWGYGSQAREVITEAIDEVKGISSRATMAPGETSLTVDGPAAESLDDAVEREPLSAAADLDRRVSVLERIARDNGLLTI